MIYKNMKLNIKTKDNSKITIQPDERKSYVYIKDGKKDIGFLSWNYDKKKWMFNRY